MRLKGNHVAVAAWGFGAVLLAGAMTGCGSSSVATMSPQLDGVTVESSSSLTEESQQVVVTIPFASDVAATGDVKVAIDGKEADSKAVATEVRTEGSGLIVTLTPGSAAGATNTGTYFALYQGQVEVSGGVLAEPVSVVVPSGMKIKTVSKAAGKTVVKVTQPAQIRCCTWFAVGDEKVFTHHHQFLQETCETCASDLADSVNTNLEGAYSAKARGAQVTVTSTSNTKFDVSILEGAGVQL